MRLRPRTWILGGQIAIVILSADTLELLVGSGTVSPLILSRPSVVLARLTIDFSTWELWEAFATSAAEVSLALLFSLLLGGIIGYALYRFSMFRQAVEPLLVAFYSAPAVLLYPVFLSFFGQGAVTVISMAVLLGTVPIAINISVGFSGIAPLWHKVGRSLHATPRQMLFRIFVPAATPIIVAGFRLGLTFALVGVISLEFLTYSGGLGRLVSWRYFVFDTDGVFAAIVLVMVIAIAINSLLNALENNVRARWG